MTGSNIVLPALLQHRQSQKCVESSAQTSSYGQKSPLQGASGKTKTAVFTYFPATVSVAARSLPKGPLLAFPFPASRLFAVVPSSPEGRPAPSLPPPSLPLPSRTLPSLLPPPPQYPPPAPPPPSLPSRIACSAQSPPCPLLFCDPAPELALPRPLGSCAMDPPPMSPLLLLWSLWSLLLISPLRFSE